jgi:hypothetical protein
MTGEGRQGRQGKQRKQGGKKLDFLTINPARVALADYYYIYEFTGDCTFLKYSI